MSHWGVNFDLFDIRGNFDIFLSPKAPELNIKAVIGESERFYGVVS